MQLAFGVGLHAAVHRVGPAPALCNSGRSSGRRRTAVNASASDSDVSSLPIFPLGVVALPSADIPLTIFEARYRVLFSTLLAGEPGVNEGLVQEDSPFKGTKRFGMCFTDRNGLAKCGTVLEITNHECMEDGRILVLTRGAQRFVIEQVEQEKPVLRCKVKYFQDKQEDVGALGELAEEVRGLFRDTLRLNAKYKRVTISEDFLNPPQLSELEPDQLSFWMMSMMSEATQMQQQILESESPRARLETIKAVLVDTTKYLSAAVALESIMTSPSPESSADVDSRADRPGPPDL